MTSLWILDSFHDCLCQIHDLNFEIFQPNQFAAPAAHIQAFVDKAICTRLPNHAQWVCALNADKELLLVRQLDNNPSLIHNKSLHAINHNFHLALRRSLIVVENNLLIYCEPISNTGPYAWLTIVPTEFYNVLFVAFHTIPAGGHLNSYRTLHCICLHYYWLDMYSYIKRMCSACQGYALANLTRGKLSELVYNFPIKAPLKVLPVDAYSASPHSSFEGSTSYLIGCCGMCSLGILEPITAPMFPPLHPPS
jgi:hypothetical protein